MVRRPRRGPGGRIAVAEAAVLTILLAGLFAGSLGAADAVPERSALPGPGTSSAGARGPETARILALEAHPPSILLRGPHSFQRLVVLGAAEGGRRVDVTARVRLSAADPAVVEVGAVDGEARPAVLPRGDGGSAIRVLHDGQELEVPVVVSGQGSERPPRFADEVVGSLTRAGCNSGACHGSQHGKGGFKLSLLGYEPEDDLVAITREVEGRRVALFDPPESLILRKPLLDSSRGGGLSHGGGKRFEAGSTTHHMLERWLEAGAPAPAESDPRVESIRVFPSASVLAPGETMHLLVTARLSDGTEEDVTGRALLASLNEGVAALEPAARVAARAAGETAITVRYQGQAQAARITVPYRHLEAEPPLPPHAPAPEDTFIDQLAARKWRALGLVPSPPASDAEFLRRVYLTAIGTLPTPQEAAAFLDEPDPTKREKLIDKVLERPEYVDAWALKWGDLLRIDRQKLGEKGMWSFLQWLRGALRENRRLDRMVEELVTAQGSTFTSGPANFFRVARSPGDLAETVGQVFLGLRLQCAQCHHHPFEKWSQEDYHGLAAYFGRLGLKSSSEFGVYGEEQVVFVKQSGEVRHPRTGRVVPPKPLEAPASASPAARAGGGTVSSPLVPPEGTADRRRALAEWLTGSRLFALNIANRYWGYLMGRGIVEPIDDLRVTNPATNPELLEALADELVRSGYDGKHLLRTILRSRVFALSSRPREENRPDEVFFSRYPVQRLPAEVLLDAIVAATGVPEAFPGLPPGTRALQLPDARLESYFLESFGKPRRDSSCECERVSLPNMAQALQLMNGDLIGRKVSDGAGRVARMVKEGLADEKAVEELYLATLCRRPSGPERERALTFLVAPGAGGAASRKEGLEDLLWGLCNSSEFLFNH